MRARARLLSAALCILAFTQGPALFAADATAPPPSSTAAPSKTASPASPAAGPTSSAGPASPAGPVAPDVALARGLFSREGSNDVSVASGTGSTAEEAEELAKGAALRGLFDGLGKDRLFAEVFTASPPLSLSIQLVSSSKEGLGYKGQVRLQIDDESVRIVERGPYLAAAIGILDKAEAQSDEAEARRAGAVAAETRAELGTALGQYGMAIDACRSALELVDPVADPSLFSTKGKRTAPELKKNLSSILAESSAGVERVKKAEAALAADESSVAATGVADAAIAEADKAQALLKELAPTLENVSAFGEEKLTPTRDRIATERRSLGDSKAALERARAALPQDKAAKDESAADAKGPSFASDKLDFARRRLETADSSLAAAFRTVDREIRDPASRRAARAQAIRWAFLHEPREYVALRAYLPFAISAGKDGLTSAPFDFAGDFEGAFPFGGGGVWARSQVALATTDFTPAVAGGDELAFSQSFDFGVWRKSLFFVGYQWDWLRHVDGGSYPEIGAAEVGIGGVYEHGASTDRFRRADWLIALSYQIPYAMEFELQNILNFGLGATFRLGNLALLEASVSKRLDGFSGAGSVTEYYSVLSWAIGLGLRLPPPFAIGAQFFGAYPQLLENDGSLATAPNFDGGHFRFYLQYSI